MNAEHIKVAVDGLSVGTALATLASWLPPIASLFTIIWMGIRIFESKTVQRLLGREP